MRRDLFFKAGVFEVGICCSLRLPPSPATAALIKYYLVKKASFLDEQTLSKPYIVIMKRCLFDDFKPENKENEDPPAPPPRAPRTIHHPGARPIPIHAPRNSHNPFLKPSL